MKRVGILGGGQLGMLLSQSIVRLGAQAIIFDPDPSAPACRAVKHAINAAWDDQNALTSFFNQCDVVTYEFENVPSTAVRQFETTRSIYPNLSLLEKTQNRILEKTFLKNCGLPYVNFTHVTDPKELPEAVRRLTFPIIAKSAVGGYDGKFQYLLNSEEETLNLSRELKRLPEANFSMTLEEVVDLKWELSCITARSKSHEEIAFPVFKNVHTDHILDTTTVPATIPADLKSKLLDISLDAARKLELTGLLCTEFFVAATDEKKHTGVRLGDFTIYINEFAPRPHNSGHVTTSACSVSQYDALARVLLNIPLSQPRMLAPGYFCMGNLLGDIWTKQGHGARDELDLSALKTHPDIIEVVIYGKTEPKAKRKMGHLIAYAASPEEAEAAVKRARQSLSENVTRKALA
jgi:5-(carboxyamino)imidazole ribonucleotide synthase